uniref:CSON002700 protein n=1 Tax=Culicoides sonorensis TaxID=179676 RepID=A0A336MP54_CULSO
MKVELCEGYFCNNQIFPENRMQCYQCEEGCQKIDPENHKIKPCVNYKENDECFVIALDSNTTYRGCTSDVNTLGIETCNDQNYSKYCLKNKFNDQDSIDNSFSCMTCERKIPEGLDIINGNCYDNKKVSSCGPVLLGREPDKCFTIMEPELIQRGCLSLGNNMQDCNEAGDNCNICSQSVCNNEIYRDNNGIKNVSRGCLHTIPNEILKNECASNSTNCKICEATECNKKVNFQECIECDSNTNENCATLSDVSKLPLVRCKNYHDKCYARLYKDDTNHLNTIRGCASEDFICPLNDTNCLTCDSNNCNNGVVPISRVQCFHCDENVNPDCSFMSEKLPPLHYCVKYDDVKGDQCYTKLDLNKKIIRGCISDLKSQTECDKNGKCLKCNYDGCNRQLKFSKPSLFCVNCESNFNRNNSCLWGQHTSSAELCKNTVEFGTTEECFSMTSQTGHVKRGCLHDNPQICDQNTCKKCTTSGCNQENVIKQSCVTCNSTTDPSCDGKTKIQAKTCSKELQLFEERWCYTYRDLRDNSIHRGCFSELSDEIKRICLNNENRNCDICEPEGCNNKIPPNSSSQLKFSVLFVIILSILILKL